MHCLQCYSLKWLIVNQEQTLIVLHCEMLRVCSKINYMYLILPMYTPLFLWSFAVLISV